MKDEAFVIGFTMGSTNRVSTTEEKLYSFFAKYSLPQDIPLQRFGYSHLQRRGETGLYLGLPTPIQSGLYRIPGYTFKRGPR